MMSHIVEKLLEEAQIDPFVQNLVGQLVAEMAPAAHEPEESVARILVEAIKAMSADRAWLSVRASDGINAIRILEKIGPLLEVAANLKADKADFRAGQHCGDDSLPIAGGLAVLDRPRLEPRALALDWVPFEDGRGAFAQVGFARLIAGHQGAWAIVGHGSGRVEGGGLLDAQLAAEAAAKEVLASDLGMRRLVGGAGWRA
jgi:hypothetical protein